MLLDFSKLPARANADGEFALHARFWNATVKLRVGQSSYRLAMHDGRLTECTPWLGAIAGDLAIEADEAEWANLLEPMPKPFYQDLYAATIHHGFSVAGNTLNYCAYYPALRRLVELMREERHHTPVIRHD
jgi:hypothetical protein